MKKRLALVCLILAVLFLLTGCIRISATVTVHSNGKADINLLMAGSDSLGEDSGFANLSEEEQKEYEELGYTCTPYADEEDGYTGFTLTMAGVDLEELSKKSGSSETVSTLTGGFKVNGKHVVLDTVPFDDEDEDMDLSYLSMIKMDHGYMKFVLELPKKPASHNATSVSADGKTLTWDLTKLSPGESIHAEFDLSGGSALIWLIPLIVVILAAGAFFLLRSRRKQAPAPMGIGAHAMLEPQEIQPPQTNAPDDLPPEDEPFT